MTWKGGWGRRLLTALLLAAALAFLYHTAATNWRDLEGIDWRVNPLVLAASVAAHVAVLALGVWIWSRVLRQFGSESTGYRRLLGIWSLANITRYIPGAVWQFFTTAHLARSAGLPGVLGLTSLLVHVGFTLLAATLIAAWTLPLELLLGVAPGAAGGLRLGALVAAAAAIHPWMLNLLLRLVPRALGREVLVWRGSWAASAGLLALSLVSWALYGFSFYLFLHSLTPLPATSIPALTGVNALSFLAGYLVVFAPGGIGVRESAMTLLLTSLLPPGVAAIFAIASRLWSIVAEVALAAAGVARARRRPAAPAPSDP
jgi:glycosyltransferase 2 family protein